MGKFSKGLADLAKANRGAFIPRELNSENVRNMLARCSAATETKNAVKDFVFKKDFDFDEDYFEHDFDQDVLDEQFDNILYMLGQLKEVHSGKNILTVENMIYNYNGEIWTGMTQQEARRDVYGLIALGSCAHRKSDKKSAISYLMADAAYGLGDRQIIGCHVSSLLKPTLSPKDPDYVDPRKK